MRSSSLDAVHDAIHGPIDIATLGGPALRSAVAGILSSPEFGRLRRIKQLGFVSTNYISASHDRYAHSIGSMYMMRRILDRLCGTEAFTRPECHILDALRQAYPETFLGDEDKDISALIEHLMIVALIQDIGELPYNLGSTSFFFLSERLKGTIAPHVNADVGLLEMKIVYALAWLRQPENARILESFDLDLLSDLLGNAGQGMAAPGLRAVRHIVDGAVDADRLDYVHRDAFHVLGVRRDPNAVVSSLLYYDEDGPVFSASGPIADFLAVRATLWASVYLSPPNRFRLTLLRTLIKDMAESSSSGSLFHELKLHGLGFEDFARLDDAVVDQEVDRARSGSIKVNSPKAACARHVLTDRNRSYEYYWLAEPAEELSGVESPARLPAELFVDTYFDYKQHRLYAARSIRVWLDPYKYMGGVVPLERCSGPINHLLTEHASGLPMPGAIAVFKPSDPNLMRGASWKAVEDGLNSGSLYYRLRKEGLGEILAFDGDTRDRGDFSGPEIFISFAFEDVDVVREIALVLMERRQRYYCLVSPHAGVGGTAISNSVEAARAAGAVLLLYSRSYAAKFSADINGPLGSEVMEMVGRVRQERLTVVPVTLESFDATGLATLPWRALGYPDGAPPLVGASLRGAARASIAEAVDGMLARLAGARTEPKP